MPSAHHEAVCQLLKRNPLLGPFLLSSTGYPQVAGRPELTDSNLSDVEREKRADVVQLIKTPAGHKIALISEVQNSRPKRMKRRAWFCYLANAGNDHDCDAILIVIASTERIARACARSFSIGHPGLVLKVIVIGPRNTPHPDSPGAEPVAIELAVLNALNGNFDLSNLDDRRYVLSKLAKADPIRRHDYSKYLYLSLPQTIQEKVKEDMTRKYRVDFLDEPFELAEQAREEAERAHKEAEEARKQTEQARERTELANKETEQANRETEQANKQTEQARHSAAAILLRQLAGRGFQVPGSIRDIIEGCGDSDRLDRWSERAVTAATLEDVFDLALT
jgi:flagellar biosynthesis GTPase FlhF